MAFQKLIGIIERFGRGICLFEARESGQPEFLYRFPARIFFKILYCTSKASRLWAGWTTIWRWPTVAARWARVVETHLFGQFEMWCTP